MNDNATFEEDSRNRMKDFETKNEDMKKIIEANKNDLKERIRKLDEKIVDL